MRTMLLAAAAGLSLAASTAAYADSGDGPAANSFSTELPGVVAQADVPKCYGLCPEPAGTAPASAERQPIDPRSVAVPADWQIP
jgi:hypothetical protein